MALSRSGGFGGGGLDPLGGGSFGSLGQYEIGADLADMELYLTETAWGNGTIDDAEYIAALRKSVAATDPNTHRRDVALNRLADAEYRIGRSVADKKGLDELIAFDQKSLGKMKPENQRYRDVESSLKAELAQRRSRDYGKLVVDYNAGKASTKSLLKWVTNAQRSIDKDDPDFDNWQGVAADLGDRLDSEQDQKVYQDFQTGKMQPDTFLKYLTGRRDKFQPGSPQYDDWSRRLADAQKQVKETAQGKVDQAFFNAYEEGHKSDADYLGYLKKRISGMESDDPDKPAWQHRMNQAAFSLAEDKLRFDVEKGKAPVSRLIGFYKDYRATLNPGSAEWRTITRSLDSLARYGGGGGGGGRSGGGGGGGSSKSYTGAGAALPPKVIAGYSIESAMQLMTVNPYSDKKAQKTAKEFFDLNYSSLDNARNRGDDVFLFFDPRKPGAVVPARHPDGSPVLGADGKPVMIRGSAYLPVSDDLFSDFSQLKANYHYGLAELALFNHDGAKYADELRQGLEAQDKSRFVDSQMTQRAFDAFYEQAQDGIDMALKSGDWKLAVNLSMDMARRLKAEIEENPMLDDTRRNMLEELGEKLADNPLLPDVDPFTGKQTGGAMNLGMSTKDKDGNFTSVALNPGWHHVLDKTDGKGGAAWGLEYDALQDLSWEQNHMPVQTTYGDKIVRGEVTKHQAGTNPTVFVNTEDGMIQTPQSADYVAFTDENGQVVRAYSIDGGKTWVRSLSGTAPQIEVTKDVHKSADGKFLVDDAGEPVFKQDAGGWTFVGQPGDIAWYGSQNSAIKAALGGYGQNIAGLPGPVASAILGAFGVSGGLNEFGAPGQNMQLVTASIEGSVSFISDRRLDQYEQDQIAARKAGATIPYDPGIYGTSPHSGALPGYHTSAGFGREFVNDWVLPVIQGLGLGPKAAPGPSRVKPPSIYDRTGETPRPKPPVSRPPAPSMYTRTGEKPPALKPRVAPPPPPMFKRTGEPPPLPRPKPPVVPPKAPPRPPPKAPPRKYRPPPKPTPRPSTGSHAGSGIA